MKKKKKKKRPVRRTVLLGILGGIVAAVMIFYLTLPRVALLRQMNPRTTSLIRYLEKNPRSRSRISWVSLEGISRYLQQAVLIAEDDKFYHHAGFDLDSLKESIRENFHRGRVVSGGSTITQQLAKNLYLTPKKSLFRKAREALITLRLERCLSKERILEIYLNVIEFGPGVYGIRAAARHYFQKSPSRLTVEESIRLVSVLPNPRRYSPLSDTSRRMRNKRLIILQRMHRRRLVNDRVFRYLQRRFGQD